MATMAKLVATGFMSKVHIAVDSKTLCGLKVDGRWVDRPDAKVGEGVCANCQRAVKEADEFEFEDEIEYRRDANPFPDGDRFTGDATRVALQDSEISGKIDHKRDLSETLKLEFGVQYETKERDNLVEEATRIRFNLPAGTAVPTTGTRPFTGFAPAAGGDNTIEREQIAPYAMLTGKAGEIGRAHV